jgi:hypothetical protein
MSARNAQTIAPLPPAFQCARAQTAKSMRGRIVALMRYTHPAAAGCDVLVGSLPRMIIAKRQSRGAVSFDNVSAPIARV